MYFFIITPYIRILDFDWLIAGVFSYLGLISFIFTAAGVFAWGFNFFTLVCIKPPNSFGIFLLYLYTYFSNMINQIWNPEVFRSKGFNFFSLWRGICENVFHFFTLTCRKPQNSFSILQPLSKQIEYSWKRQTQGIIYLASVLNNIRCN